MGRTGTISPGPSHKSSPYARLRSMSSLTQLAGRAVTVCVQVVLVSGRSGYRTRQVRAIHIIDAVVEPVAGGWGRRRGRRGFRLVRLGLPSTEDVLAVLVEDVALIDVGRVGANPAVDVVLVAVLGVDRVAAPAAGP